MPHMNMSDNSSTNSSLELHDEHNRINASENDENDDVILSSADSLNTEDHHELYDHRGQNYSVMKPQQLDSAPQGTNVNSDDNSPLDVSVPNLSQKLSNQLYLQVPATHITDTNNLPTPHTQFQTPADSSNNLLAHMQRRKSMASSVNSMKLHKTKSNTTASSTNSRRRTTNTTALNTAVGNRARRNSMDSDDSNDSQETEEDVCFPMIEYQHDRINGIDFDDLEEFARDEIQFNMLQQQLQQRGSAPNTDSASSTSISKAALKYTPSIKSVGVTSGHQTHQMSTQSIYGGSKAPTSASAVIAPPSMHDPERHNGQPDHQNAAAGKTEISFGFNRVESEEGGYELTSTTTTTNSYVNAKGDPLQSTTSNQNYAGVVNPPYDPSYFQSLYQAPDRFSFFVSDMEETIHAPSISSLLQNSGASSFKELFKDGKPTWWLDCICPTDEEMKCISKSFGIHPLTAEDIRMQESREKVELFKSYYFVCFHTFENDIESEDFLEPINVYIVVFGNGVLTFHFGPEVNHSANVRRRVRQLREYVDVNSDWLCYALIDDITDSFAPVIKNIEYEADVIEDSVYMARDLHFAEMLQRIGESRRKTMTLMRLLAGKADVIKMFAKRCQDETKGIGPALTSQVNIANLTAQNQQANLQPRADIALYLGDIQDHVLTMYQNLLSYEKIFGRSHANYLAQLQVESFNSNNKVSEMLGRVTMLGTLLVPLNIIPGLFGMNVQIPGEASGAPTLAWFFGILGVMAVVSLIALWFSSFWLKKITNPETLNEASAGGKSVFNTFISRAKSLRGHSNNRDNSVVNDLQSRLPPLPRYYPVNKPGYAKSVNSNPSKFGRYD